MSDLDPCPSCGAAVSSQSGARVFFQCGSHSTVPHYTYTSDLCDARRELAETKEYARKLNLKITDLCAERDHYKTRVAVLESKQSSLILVGGYLCDSCQDPDLRYLWNQTKP